MEADKKFTSYKNIKLGAGQRHPLARGKNRGVRAALKDRRRYEAINRQAFRDQLIGALMNYKPRDIPDMKTWVEYLRSLTTKQLKNHLQIIEGTA